MSEVREQSNKEGRLWFLGVDAEEYTGELPEARSRLCVCRDSFLMTFVTSGISLAGSRQSSIAPNAVESREAPPNTTVSVSSQRHPEQLPEVTGTFLIHRRTGSHLHRDTSLSLGRTAPSGSSSLQGTGDTREHGSAVGSGAALLG